MHRPRRPRDAHDTPRLGRASGEPFAFGPDGMLYAGTRTAGIARFDPATGSSLGFVPAGAGATDPVSFVFGDDGTLYVNDRSVQRILKFDAATGSPTGVFADYSGTGQPIFNIVYAVPVPEPASVGLVAAGMVAWTTSRTTRQKLRPPRSLTLSSLDKDVHPDAPTPRCPRRDPGRRLLLLVVTGPRPGAPAPDPRRTQGPATPLRHRHQDRRHDHQGPARQHDPANITLRAPRPPASPRTSPPSSSGPTSPG